MDPRGGDLGGDLDDIILSHATFVACAAVLTSNDRFYF